MKLNPITPSLCREIEDRFDQVNLPLDIGLSIPEFAKAFYLDRRCLCVWAGEIGFLKEPHQIDQLIEPYQL